MTAPPAPEPTIEHLGALARRLGHAGVRHQFVLGEQHEGMEQPDVLAERVERARRPALEPPRDRARVGAPEHVWRSTAPVPNSSDLAGDTEPQVLGHRAQRLVDVRRRLGARGRRQRGIHEGVDDLALEPQHGSRAYSVRPRGR